MGLTHRSFAPKLAYNLDDMQVSAESITNEGKNPIDFDLWINVRQGGALLVSGTALQMGKPG